MSDAIPTALYRLFGDGDSRLYIGISDTFGRRWQQHAHSQPWWPEVRRQSIDWYPDRQRAEDAEEKAVRSERPRYNVTYNLDVAGQRPVAQHPRIREVVRRHGALARRLRREHRVSQAALAASMRAMDWPWHQTTVVRVEQGEREMSIGEAIDLAGLYGMSFGEFVEMSQAGVSARERGAA